MRHTAGARQSKSDRRDMKREKRVTKVTDLERVENFLGFRVCGVTNLVPFRHIRDSFAARPLLLFALGAVTAILFATSLYDWLQVGSHSPLTCNL